jgi:vacuolar-type H+-ATPase subunit H
MSNFNEQSRFTVTERVLSAITMVEEARGVPLSASCVIHRGEILEILDQARLALPTDLDSAHQILVSRDAILEEAQESASQLIAHAREEVAEMVEQTKIVAAARKEAQRIMDEVEVEAKHQRDEIEAYIDSRLATLEVILNKTLDVVQRGRDKLQGADDKDILAELAE